MLKKQKHFTSAQVRTPSAFPKRDGIAIACVIKDEEDYILEWVNFHSLAGIKDFIIYDDGSTDGSIEVLRGLQHVNVTVIPWAQNTTFTNVTFSKQVLAFAHAIENFGSAFRWMAFIDVDEFLVPKSDNSLMSQLQKLDGHSNISLPWVMFGPSNHMTKPDMAVPLAYTQRAKPTTDKRLINFKCIVDPCKVTVVGVHKFTTLDMSDSSTNDQGIISENKARLSPEFITSNYIQLNHYYTKSRAEVDEKINKGCVAGSKKDRRRRKVLEKLELIEQTTVTDQTAVDFLKRHNINTTEDLRSYCGEDRPTH